jgi:amidase
MTDLVHGTAGELADALAARTVSAVELAETMITRIEALDGRINAVVVRDFDRARSAAAAADVALGQGDRRPLLGVPMTVKESFNVAGLPTTWGMPAFKDWRPTCDAAVVERIRAAGVVILGKTNVPLNLGDWQAYNEVYGTTNNPWDLMRTPGGSSGGSAAALAAGFTPLEIGSDIGGSLRAPAHFCGVYAHNPSRGLVPVRGHVPPGVPALPRETDLMVVGPMARSAADLELLLDVIAGPDAHMAAGYRLALPPPRHDELKAYRVLIVVVVRPIMPTAAFPSDQTPQEARVVRIDGQDHPYQDQLVWAAVATLPGLPATAMPIDLSEPGLPIGVQVIGPFLEDRTTIAFAGLVARGFGGFVAPAMNWGAV